MIDAVEIDNRNAALSTSAAEILVSMSIWCGVEIGAV
jgi:hypothetical protein